MDRWLQFSYQGQLVTLKGIPSEAKLGPPACQNQLIAFDKTYSILYTAQVQVITLYDTSKPSLPQDLQEVLDQFKAVFTPPSTLPPPRPGGHSIPLTDGAQPFSLSPYRYNPAQKLEIESQIADMLDKGWIQVSTSPYSSPVLLVRKKTGD
jgi:hypothetical protein